MEEQNVEDLKSMKTNNFFQLSPTILQNEQSTNLKSGSINDEVTPKQIFFKNSKFPTNSLISSASDLISHLGEVLVSCEILQTRIGLSKGYRNKITYTLGHRFQTSELAQEELNEVCTHVFHWSNSQTKLPKECWNEVSVKRTRANMILMKLIFVKIGKQRIENETWKEEKTAFCKYILEKCPSISCVTCQVSSTSSKPTKNDSYLVWYGDGKVLEKSPNGEPFYLSADSFSEVNPLVENSVFQLTSEWILPEAKNKTNLLILGRDINTNCLGLHALGFSSICSITHCRRAAMDCTSNCKLFGKSNIQVMLHEKVEIGEVIQTKLPTQNPGWCVVITAGIEKQKRFHKFIFKF